MALVLGVSSMQNWTHENSDCKMEMKMRSWDICTCMFIVAWFTVAKILKQSNSQFSSVAQSCPTLCDPMNCSMPGLPVHHQPLQFTQTHVHWVGDAIQSSGPLSSPSHPALYLSQHQSLFQSQLFSSGGPSIGPSASASIIRINIQGWFPLGVSIFRLFLNLIFE